MLRRVSKILLVITLSCSLGLHWAILQSVAWVGMAVSFSQSATLKEALEKTFDGKHPCSLCKIVVEGKKSEKKQQAQKPPTKHDLAFVASRLTIYPPSPDSPRFALPTALPTRSDPPPTPPPRYLPG